MRANVNRPVVLALVGILFLAAAVGLALFTFEGKKTPAPESSSPSVSSDAKPVPPASQESGLPSFDVVRIDPNGNAVIAGRSAPDAEVAILEGGQEIGRVRADSHGEWVFLPEKPLSPGSREFSLKSTDSSGKTAESKDVVVLMVPEHGGPALVVRSDRDGKKTEVLQGTNAPVAEGGLSVDSIDYDESGTLHLGGRAAPGGLVQVYLDNETLGNTPADAAGRWSLAPTQKAGPGHHLLRADLMDADGKVRARVEVPFDRIAIAGMPDGLRVVVQPGNSLWLLARRTYGEGMAYTVIYDANKGQIRDPDLIYPGQVFVLPGKTERSR